MAVSKMVNLAMRGFQLLWTVLIMSLAGNMIHNAFAGNPSIVNYDMFVSIFALLSLFYLIAGTVNEGFSGHPMIMVGVDLLNTLFFFCGAIATSTKLGVHSCGRADYTLHNSVTNGAYDTTKRCHEAQAVAAFLWFGFLAFAASTVLSGLQSRGSGGMNMRGGMGGIRRGPAMTQV
ncbi:hypothetical protein LTR66_014070 [Elasticomyces elasticus]|nr:hypothetical protein LTR66_014070 [Elasticomyces elasticus]KAK4964018.1 hypothetical protein LTR28_004152 [Elasticomyces elasticus]